jgi:chemotaxis protein histidine kinase CheA
MRRAHLPYALAATAALSIGLFFSFWQSTVENDRLIRANLTAGIALEAAQDEAKLLREKFEREEKDRRMAEAAQTIAESAERSAREKLAQEVKARQAGEAARAKTEAAFQETSQKLAQEEDAHWAADTERQAMASKLEVEQKSRQAAQEARLAAEAALENTEAKLRQEVQARELAETARKDAENAVTLVTAKLTEQFLAMQRDKASLSYAAARSSARRNDGLGSGCLREGELCTGSPTSGYGSALAAESQKGAPSPAAVPHVIEAAQTAVPSTDTPGAPAPEERRLNGEAWQPALQYCASSTRAFQERPDLFVPFCFRAAATLQSEAGAIVTARGGPGRPAGFRRHGLHRRPVGPVQSRRTASRTRILPVEPHIPRSPRSHLVRHPRTRRAERSAFLPPKQPALSKSQAEAVR